MTNHFVDYKNTDVFLIIGANPAENHPQVMRWIAKARFDKGARVIVADPRVTKTAALSDIHVRLRPGTDIALLYGMIHFVIENNLYFKEYVLNYTNASYLIDPSFGFEDGLFSGATEKDGKFSYDNKSWQYQKDGDTVKKDLTLQDPNCVFQILKKHVSRYDIKTVCRITGTSEATLRKVCELYGSTGKPNKAGNLIYAMGITQHTYGTQNVRTTAMLQLLLGNIGIAGGGVNAQRGESNVQGSSDMAMLHDNLPGYMSVPFASKHSALKDYIEKETPKTSYWTNKPKFLISMLKAWYGDNATRENDFRFDWLPKHDGKNRSHMGLFEMMADGKIKGTFVWGQNPAVGGPSASVERKALENLEWLVAVDLFETETAAFWKRPGADPKTVNTEVFLLPAGFSYEKEGTVSNSGRWIQFRWKAVDPPGEARSDLWIVDRLFKAIRQEYQSGGKFTDPIMNLVWNYDKPGEEEPSLDQVALEINGYEVGKTAPLASFARLADDGGTACGCWIYAGYWAEDKDARLPAAKRRIKTDKTGLGLYPQWSFAWPLNRRIVYNRCSCDPGGKPWNEKAVLVAWDGARWITNDVPDFGAKDPKTGEPIPPEKTANAPFIMNPEGQGRLFAPGLKDGPLPEHYEPVESPVKNIMSKRQNSPMVSRFSGDFAMVAEMGSKQFPHVMTTYRVIEHYQSGAVTRNCPWLVEAAPEVFAMISPQLAESIGVIGGDEIWVETARGKVKCKASVQPLMKALYIDGKAVEMVGMPWHWGYQGLAPGATANDLTPSVGDPNTNIPEYKAFLCNVRKA